MDGPPEFPGLENAALRTEVCGLRRSARGIRELDGPPIERAALEGLRLGVPHDDLPPAAAEVASNSECPTGLLSNCLTLPDSNLIQIYPNLTLVQFIAIIFFKFSAFWQLIFHPFSG